MDSSMDMNMDNNTDTVMGNTDNQARCPTPNPVEMKVWLIHFLTTTSNVLENVRAKNLNKADELVEIGDRKAVVADLIQVSTNCEGLAERLELHQDAHVYRAKKHELEKTLAELNAAMALAPQMGWKGGPNTNQVVSRPSQVKDPSVKSKATRGQGQREERARRGRKQQFRQSQGGPRRGNTSAVPAA